MSHTASTTHATGVHAPGAHPLVGHLVPAWLLVFTGTVLLLLTAITVAVRYIDIGEFNIVVALGVALIKATLVCLFFMHLRWDRPFNILVFIASAVFVILMMAFLVMDTSQYFKDQFTGNAPEVETTLQANAPGAPVARFKSYSP
ncbi:MAG: cytochrome C oxidase subunit IV family protein [Planctomycetes bacterium]|nr:cytochrome C oxidase subunit IV family protein [Planctomycetota bacterium]